MNGMNFAGEVRRLVNSEMAVSEIALIVGKSESTVAKAIAIDKRLTDQVKAEAGDLTLDILYEISQVPVEKQLALLRDVHAKQLSRRQVRSQAAIDKTCDFGRKKRDRSTQKTILVNGATITITCAGKVGPAEIKAALEAAVAKVVAA